MPKSLVIRHNMGEKIINNFSTRCHNFPDNFFTFNFCKLCWKTANLKEKVNIFWLEISYFGIFSHIFQNLWLVHKITSKSRRSLLKFLRKISAIFSNLWYWVRNPVLPTFRGKISFRTKVLLGSHWGCWFTHKTYQNFAKAGVFIGSIWDSRVQNKVSTMKCLHHIGE